MNNKDRKIISIQELSLKQLVVHSPVEKISPEKKENLIGVEYDETGSYQKFFFPNEPYYLACFIAKSDKNKLVTNDLDYAVLCAAGKEICKHKLSNIYEEQVYAELMRYEDQYSNFDEVYFLLKQDDEDEL